MLRRELLLMSRDAPLRVALILWVIAIAGFTVSMYPVTSSYAGLGGGFELLDGLYTTLVVAGAIFVPWMSSRLTWRERDRFCVLRLAMHGAPGVGLLAKAGVAHILVLLLMALSLPLVTVAYRTGTVSPTDAVLGLAEATLFLSLVSTLTLHVTLRRARFLLSLGVAYGTMIAVAVGRFTLIDHSGNGGTLIIAAALNLLSILTLMRRADNELVYLQP